MVGAPANLWPTRKNTLLIFFSTKSVMPAHPSDVLQISNRALYHPAMIDHPRTFPRWPTRAIWNRSFGGNSPCLQQQPLKIRSSVDADYWRLCSDSTLGGLQLSQEIANSHADWFDFVNIRPIAGQISPPSTGKGSTARRNCHPTSHLTKLDATLLVYWSTLAPPPARPDGYKMLEDGRKPLLIMTF